MCNPLREKFEEWQEWLLGEDVHSIRNQIHTMIWASATFQSINEARRYAPTNDKGQIELNENVHQFIDRCFFETQATAIRRLLDKETSHRGRSVISLYRLLHDMEDHNNNGLLTRKNIIDSLGLPYDYERAKQEVSKESDFTNGPRWMGDDHKRCKFSKHAHQCLDLLTGIYDLDRSPDDVVRADILQWLKARLKKCEAVSAFVNKFLAHSATPVSRAEISDEQTDITLGQIFDAHKTICQIAEFVSQNLFLGSIGNPLPVYQGNQFEHFEKPWAIDETLTKLHEWWRNYSKTTDQWRTWDWQAELPTCS